MVDKKDCYVGFNLFNNKNVKILPDIRSIGGQIPALPPIFFLPKNSLYGYRVEEGQIKKGCEWGEGVSVY
jgi:hypothetical protein